MAECREFDEVTSDTYYDRRGSHYAQHAQYRLALCDTSRELQNLHFPALMVLETIHAMWILSVIIRFSYAQEDRIAVSLVFETDFAPMIPYFDPTNMTLDEISDSFYNTNLREYLEQTPCYWGKTQIRKTYLALKFYHQSILDPADNGSGTTVAKIIGLLNEIVYFTWRSVKVAPLSTTHEE